jgi:hypothetical protein
MYLHVYCSNMLTNVMTLPFCCLFFCSYLYLKIEDWYNIFLISLFLWADDFTCQGKVLGVFGLIGEPETSVDCLELK